MFSASFKQDVIIANHGKIRVKKPQIWLYPKNLENSYSKTVVGYFTPFQKLVEEMIYPVLPGLVAQSKMVRPDSDSDTDVVVKTDDWVASAKAFASAVEYRYNQVFSEKEVAQQAALQAEKVSAFNKTQFVKVIHSSLSVNPVIGEPYLQSQMASFVDQNVELVKNLKSIQAARLQETLLRELSQGNDTDVIKQSLQKSVFRFSKKRAELIARDQTNKFNGQLTKLRQQELGIEDYIWRTSHDERVRPEHRKLDGKERSWKENPIPGEPVRCRCTAQPVITDEMFTK